MTQRPKKKRRYDSSRRRAQAEQTQQRVLEAARATFIARGWSGATVDLIAREAGVAPETIYAAFGNKVALLSRLVELAVKGDPRPGAVLDREGPRAVLAEPDPRRQLHMFAPDLSARLGQVSPLMQLLRAAGSTEPELDGLYRSLQAARLKNMTRVVQSLASHGGLRAGLDEASAAETLWALTSPELYLLLTGVRGWTAERHAAWLEGTLASVLLPPERR